MRGNTVLLQYCAPLHLQLLNVRFVCAGLLHLEHKTEELSVLSVTEEEHDVVLICSSYSSSIVRNLIAFLYSCLAALIHHVLASINDGVTPLPPAIAQQNPIHYIVWILLPQIQIRVVL